MVERRRNETIREGKYLNENMENFSVSHLPIWEVFAYSIYSPLSFSPTSKALFFLNPTSITYIIFCSPFCGLWIAAWPTKSVQHHGSAVSEPISFAIFC